MTRRYHFTLDRSSRMCDALIGVVPATIGSEYVIGGKPSVIRA